MYLERHGLFDPTNEAHLFSLQHTYLPLVNGSLQELMQNWNFHGISTENNITPRQLWIQGMLENSQNGYVAVNDVLEDVQPDLSNYGIDEEGPVPEEDESTSVIVPQCPIELSDEHHTELGQVLATLVDDDEYGILTYCTVVDFIEHRQLNSY